MSQALDTKSGQAVLLTLLEGNNYPNRISKEIHMDVSTVSRTLGSLAKEGFVRESQAFPTDLLKIYAITRRGEKNAREIKKSKAPIINKKKKEKLSFNVLFL